MILQSLVEYYEILAAAGEISKPGYSIANVSFALHLSPEGELLAIIPLKNEVQRGKKKVEVPQSMEVPEQEKKAAGIKANFLCDASSYILGIDKKDKPERANQCLTTSRELHHQILDDLASIEAKAVLAFYDRWRPDQASDCVVLNECIEEISGGGNIVFLIDGQYAHNNPAIRRAWEVYKTEKDDAIKMQCLITGEIEPVARLHPSIKGVKGAQAVGASIVSFNARSYESYGRDDAQGLNAPISEYAAFAYTTALNQLLRDGRHKQSFGDTTVVYWAMSPKKIYQDILAFFLNPVAEEGTNGDMVVDTKVESGIHVLFQKFVAGEQTKDFSADIDPNTRFYILGLAPNAARLSVRFFAADSFGNIMDHLASHYRDLEIEKAPQDFAYLPLWKLMAETVSPKARDKAASPLLAGAVLRSIFMGLPYPEIFFSSVLIRIRAERDISRAKAAIIKACLLRRCKDKYKEELTVSLNEQSENKAYVLGRLFAVLEKAQLDKNPGINATIKDRYFASACANPASIFPVLLRLSNYHIAKAEYGYSIDRRIQELLDKLEVGSNPFPSHLSLNDQGIFILGYYHQKKAFYTKKDQEEK